MRQKFGLQMSAISVSFLCIFSQSMKTFCNICEKLTDNLDRIYNMSNMKIFNLISIFCGESRMKEENKLLYINLIFSLISWMNLEYCFEFC